MGCSTITVKYLVLLFNFLCAVSSGKGFSSSDLLCAVRPYFRFRDKFY